LIEPSKEDVGRGVVYTAYEGALPEDGVITDLWGEAGHVFVRYKGQHPGAHGKSTPCANLVWLAQG